MYSIGYREKCDVSHRPRLRRTHSPHAAPDPFRKESNSAVSAWRISFSPAKSLRCSAVSKNTSRSGPLSHWSMGTVKPRLAWV